MTRTLLLCVAVLGCRHGPPKTGPDTAGDTGASPTLTHPTGDTATTEDTTPPWTGPTETDLVDWVPIAGGTYLMGSVEPDGLATEWPAHPVTLEAFELARTELTVGQFRACVDAGSCAPVTDPAPNCSADPAVDPGRVQGCLTWAQARDACGFLGGHLPTEAQWEYAARSLGRAREYPWGDEEPSCELARLGVYFGCEVTPSLPCQTPDGNTEQGICDMAGNLFEWVQDWFVDNYEEASPTGVPPATPGPGDFRGMRGGGVGSEVPFRTRQRTFHPPDFYYGGMGTRCAR